MVEGARLESVYTETYRGLESHPHRHIPRKPQLQPRNAVLSCSTVSLVGPLAMTGYELRQARKGATVVAESCAVVWLAGAAI